MIQDLIVLENLMILEPKFENGTHLLRLCLKLIDKNTYNIIPISEYHRLLDLSKKYNLETNIRDNPRHWGIIINEGESSLISLYTTQQSTIFNGIGRVNNIPINNLFHYANRLILIRNDILLNYVEISNDVSAGPRNLINAETREIVDNSLNAVEMIRSDLINNNYHILEFDGRTFNHNFLNQNQIDRFSSRIQDMMEKERNMQIRNITRDYGLILKKKSEIQWNF